MAEAKKCDRCGEFYDIHTDMKFNGLRLTRETKATAPVTVEIYDLCLSCTTELNNWLDMKRGNK